MAALQQTSLTLNTKLPSSSSSRAPLFTKPTNLSFSSTFPSSLTLTTTHHHRRRDVRMMAASAADSYATALLDVAKANNTLDATCADIEKIENMFSEKAVSDFFNNPTITIDKKRDVINEMASSSSLQPHVVNFLNLLLDSERTNLIKEIVKEFELEYNKMTDTELAVVTSVVKLENEHMAQIAKQVQRLTGAKNVRIKTVIDKSLVAGFTVRYGGSGSKMIDMSVKKQLEEIAAQLDLGDIQLAA